MNAEQQRLAENDDGIAIWHRWGPYLSERQWGTVREDYSADGNAWDYFPHDHARSRVYRWGEDGLAGFCDRNAMICFSIALWNGKDPILKERLFGLTNSQGNHGEDVKEAYFYLDNTPTHSYMKYLYKYPQSEFPYTNLVEESTRRSKAELEYELADTGVFEESRYFDVFVEYAKAEPEDICIRLTIANRGPEAAPLTVLPTLLCRNNWSWGYDYRMPKLSEAGDGVIHVETPRYGGRWLACEAGVDGQYPELLFTGNETNHLKLCGIPNSVPYVKDAFHDYIIQNKAEAVDPAKTGTKAAAVYRLNVEAGQSVTIRLRLSPDHNSTSFDASFENIFDQRKKEADEFYEAITPGLSDDLRNIQRQAFAGLLWNKQYYHLDIRHWQWGDPTQPKPPPGRVRNHDWRHFSASEILSMPDKWEYPWFAAWDSAFHTIPFALIDPKFAKSQLLTLTREWYMHPNGQIPAYEWAFSDVNPPVHAWAAHRVYQIDRRMSGVGDITFLKRMFNKLLLNFTWWVNRKDEEGNNVFEGGFLGLDNIGVFDRSKPFEDGTLCEQADGTAWMGMFCLNMLEIALELARHDPAYEDVASKFFEHFIYIADALNHIGMDNVSLWDEEDGFYYDRLRRADGSSMPLRVHSVVGLVPLFAVMTFEADVPTLFPGFQRRMDWFIENRGDLVANIASPRLPGSNERRILSLVPKERLERILSRMLNEREFLSPHGLRALSRFHAEYPYQLELHGEKNMVEYNPAESTSGMFGGNSNWRGPLWFPINYLLIESLQKFDYYYGSDLQVECPTGSGQPMSLWDVSVELSRRMISLFVKDAEGRRPCYGGQERFQNDPHWQDLLLFHEYFHGDNGAGLGACQQTGWTGLIAKIIQQSGK